MNQRSLPLRLAILGARAIRSIGLFPKTDTCVVPAATKGSLGDQALLQAVQDQDSIPGRRLRQVLVGNNEAIDLAKPCAPALRIFAASLHSKLRFLRCLLTARQFCVTGADIIDGRYDQGQALTILEYLDLAATAGVPTRIFGFSFSEHPKPAVVQAFKALHPGVRISVRDPVSAARFFQSTGREFTQVADLAFLLRPQRDESIAPAIAWLQERNTDGKRPVFALNANRLTCDDVQRIVSTYASVIQATLERLPDSLFFLISHDTRGDHSDNWMHARIVDALPAAVRESIFLTPHDLNAWSAKHLVSLSDAVLTGRMHLTVAALALGVPVLSIGYMGKFEGLLGFFALQQLLVSPQEAYGTDKLSVDFLELIRAKDSVSDKIRQHLPAVKELARLNF